MTNKRSNNFIDRTGQQFGRLTVIKLYRVTNDHKHVYWLCKCSCGNIKSIVSDSLVAGTTKSCGCLNKELARIRGKKLYTVHGMTGTKFHKIWLSMLGRCNDLNNLNYGGKGITVCEHWLKFENFRDDMYESYLSHVEEFGEKNTSIDRRNNDNNYEPANIRWTTLKEQQRNKRTSSKTENYDEHLYWKTKLGFMINQILERNTKSSKNFQKYVGCSILEFKQHIESQFLLGMSWKNHGQYFGTWQLDHIIGCNNFDLSKEEDRKECFNYTNFQPLWKEDHIQKSTIRNEQ